MSSERCVNGYKAELLGAVFGDGYIQQRGKQSWKVAVTVGDKYPAWLMRVKELFTLVYGGYHVYQKHMKALTEEFGDFFEIYWTTHDVIGDFGVAHKYIGAGADKLMVPPPRWVDDDEECTRLFLKSLVETDGWFLRKTEKRSASNGAQFGFAQKPGVLIGWVRRALRARGWSARISAPPSQKEMNYVIVDRQAHVAAIGEWLRSLKWKALLDSGFQPKTGRRAAGGESSFWSGVNSGLTDEIQEEWRRLRTDGASIVAIGRHYGRANSVVHAVVKDIVPTSNRSTEELGLVTKPRFPMEKRVPRSEVDEWRSLAGSGVPCREIAKRFGRSLSMVNEATCDVERPEKVRAVPK